MHNKDNNKQTYTTKVKGTLTTTDREQKEMKNQHHTQHQHEQQTNYHNNGSNKNMYNTSLKSKNIKNKIKNKKVKYYKNSINAENTKTFILILTLTGFL